MSTIIENILKERVINRILKYTFIYTREGLTNLSLKELRHIQCKQFIGLNIKINYINRHN